MNDYTLTDQTEFATIEPILEENNNQHQSSQKRWRNKKVVTILTIGSLVLVAIIISWLLISNLPNPTMPATSDVANDVIDPSLSDVDKRIIQIKTDLIEADPTTVKLPFPQVLTNIAP